MSVIIPKQCQGGLSVRMSVESEVELVNQRSNAVFERKPG